MDDRLLEPVEAYKYYEHQFEEEADEYIRELTAKACIDVEQNRATVNEYRKQAAAADLENKKTSRLKTTRGFLIFICVTGFIAAIIGIFEAVNEEILAAVLCISIGLVVAITAIIVIVRVLSPKIKHGEERVQLHEKQASNAMKEGYRQMNVLNGLFDSDITHTLIHKTVPQIILDKNFDIRRYDYLSEKYGFGENKAKNRSTLAIISGEILGNPFVVDREQVRTMGTKTYTGSITIHWTTTHIDSKGRTITEHHSQILTASVTKPKPYYSEETRLIYGNEAAPDLSFSHEPAHAERYSEKELNRMVRSGEKALNKLQEKAVKDGKRFTVMGNAKFDVLFGALDRDNEVQFRLLFTPLAQKNMLTLMTEKTGFGDDFTFNKRKCLNYVSSEHSAYWDLNTDYTRYRSFDYDACVKSFKEFNSAYFKSLYFDLAPLLSIPLYQQHKPQEYIYKDVYPRNYTSYEAECSVNRFGEKYFAPSDAMTPSILKTAFISKDGRSDKLVVTAHTFKVEKRVDFIPEFGGDGRIHEVPVEWDEYIPVKRSSTVKMKELYATDKQFEGVRDRLGNYTRSKYSFDKGLLCALVDPDDDTFDSMINREFAEFNK